MTQAIDVNNLNKVIINKVIIKGTR